MLKTIITTISIFAILFTGFISSFKTSADTLLPKFDSSEFQKVGDIVLPNKIELPTVFKLDKSNLPKTNKNNIQISNQYGQLSELYFTNDLIDNLSQKQVNLKVKSQSPTKQFINYILDKNMDSFTEFDIDKDKGEAEFTLDLDGQKELSGIWMDFTNDSRVPDFIEITGQNGSDNFTILAKSQFEVLSYKSKMIPFPKTQVDKITVKLFHSQILRVLEVSPIIEDQSKVEVTQSLYFLTKPGENYNAFISYNSINFSNFKTLPSDLGYKIQTAKVENIIDNSAFTMLDTDKDGILNSLDNCPLVANKDQIDKDINGKGDACEDRDLDGIIDTQDNCPLINNSSQSDVDKDGQGDACDNRDNRFLENNTWIVPSVIVICLIVVIFVFTKRFKKIGD
jgi:hypothetical protein